MTTSSSQHSTRRLHGNRASVAGAACAVAQAVSRTSTPAPRAARWLWLGAQGAWRPTAAVQGGTRQSMAGFLDKLPALQQNKAHLSLEGVRLLPVLLVRVVQPL
jgi:hypothetical protein